MKKNIFAAFVLFLMASTASYAGEIYLSPSVLLSDAEVTYLADGSAYANVIDKNSDTKQNAGFSVEAGYRGYFGGFFIGPELFYNYHNLKLTGFKNTTNAALSSQDEIKLNYSYGLALNLGYKFTKKFALYGRLGVGAANSDVTWYNRANNGVEKSSQNDSISVLTIGMLYDLSKNVALKLSYENETYTIDRSELFDNLFANNRKPSFDICVQSVGLGMLFKF